MKQHLPALLYGFGGSYFITTQNDYLALLSFQAVTLLMLISMSLRVKSPWGIKAWILVLGISFLARMISLAINKMSPINKAAKFRRWDALATMIGYSITTGYLIKTIIPGKAIRKYVGLVSCGIPSVVAMGMAFFSKHENDLIPYAKFSGDVYDTHTFRDDKTDTRIAIHNTTEDSVTIAFAGTDSSKNVLTDLRVTDTAFPACSLQKTRVHAGFMKAWNTVRDKVFEAIKDKKAVTFTGHSLGGALAMLAGLDIACTTDIKNISVITFGAPAVGDELFVDSFSQKISRSVRVVNPLDPVPRSLTSQFTHVKGLYFVPSAAINPHDISSYQKAAGYSMAWKIISMVLPLVYAAIIVLVFLKLKKGIFKLKKKIVHVQHS